MDSIKLQTETINKQLIGDMKMSIGKFFDDNNNTGTNILATLVVSRILDNDIVENEFTVLCSWTFLQEALEKCPPPMEVEERFKWFGNEFYGIFDDNGFILILNKPMRFDIPKGTLYQRIILGGLSDGEPEINTERLEELSFYNELINNGETPFPI